ncbi:MAG: glycosyl hydrolase family 2, partial [Bacteroidia bacterium]|nr:glycosyl hydrolase family 2 [Bacteroidia bacterium]
MKSLKLILVLCALCLVPCAFSQLTLPTVIGSHMVLQQKSDAPLWGWAKPGENISITTSWNGNSAATIAGADGKWMLKVKTPAAGGPYSIEISGKNKIVLDDILIGEVWLCSGQSNMEMPLKGWPEWGGPIDGSAETIQAANYPNMRLFTVNRAYSFVPVDTCTGSWKVCTPESAKDFSATGYFFGLQLFQKLNIPVGLIHSSWGGTAAEAWTSSEYISKIPKFATSPGICDPDLFYKSAIDNYNKEQEKWVQSIGFGVSDQGPDWSLASVSGMGWSDIKVPAEWATTPIGTYNGIVEYQLTFKVPKGWIEKATVIELGPIDEMDVTWLNGKLIGNQLNPSGYATPRAYTVPAGTLIQGENILALRVANTSGLGGINGKKKDMRIRLQKSKSGGHSLAGTWKARKGQPFDSLPPGPDCVNCNYPNTPTMLYNGMIKPVIPYTIKGAIWYQGESNRYDGLLYRQIFKGMIENWRHDWNQGDFPFYFVQIAPYNYKDHLSTGLLREAQEYAMKKLPNTGMVVTMDIGDLKNIHPGNKLDIGKRLANWALAKDYGLINTAYTGPIYRSFQKEGEKIRIIFDYAFGGLTSFGEELKHFQIAGADGVFKPAKAEIYDKTVVVFSDEVKVPVAVRFG